jgi:hypothetical protein
MMKKSFLCLLVMAASSWPALAFIEEPPNGAKPVPERSQEQLAKEQALHQGIVPEIGQVPENTEDKQVDDSALLGTDNGSMASAEQRMALDSMATAKKVQERSKAPNSTGLWGLVCLLAGFTIILAFRQVANKVVPPAQPPTKITW